MAGSPFGQAIPQVVNQWAMQPAPTFTLADLALQGDKARVDAALQNQWLGRELRTRTLPSIINRRAGRGAFYSGQTTLESAKALEDMQRAQGQVNYDLSNSLGDMLRRRIDALVGAR